MGNAETYKDTANRLGVSMKEYEDIFRLKKILNDITYNLHRRNEEVEGALLKGVGLEYAKAYAISVEKEMPGLLSQCRIILGSIPSALTYDKPFLIEVFSTCCGVSPSNIGGMDSELTGICPACKEHTDFN